MYKYHYFSIDFKIDSLFVNNNLNKDLTNIKNFLLYTKLQLKYINLNTRVLNFYLLHSLLNFYSLFLTKDIIWKYSKLSYNIDKKNKFNSQRIFKYNLENKNIKNKNIKILYHKKIIGFELNKKIKLCFFNTTLNYYNNSLLSLNYLFLLFNKKHYLFSKFKKLEIKSNFMNLYNNTSSKFFEKQLSDFHKKFKICIFNNNSFPIPLKLFLRFLI